ncbi:MAG: HIRAN domain-containing protein [Acutalibacteraceae bacterium]|nr:HIRAN domain-containing protein [Acutalibacteraceae bacterium]
MSDLVKSENGGLVSLLHGKGGDLVIPKPFEKDIFLFDTYIAGTTHIEGIEELEPHLNNDDKLDFFREPDNRYDKEAIMIKTSSGVKIGYVPKQDNVIFARLMDAGKLLFGRISYKEKKGKWIKIKIKVYLHE